MDKKLFWNLIDTSRHDADGVLGDQVEILQKLLEEFAPDDIAVFDDIFHQYWVQAYTWDLWGAAYLIGDGCSDEGFMDFRGWLISKGQKAYEAALRDAEALMEIVSDDDDDCQFQGFESAAPQAWQAKTGRGLSDFPRGAWMQPEEPSGEIWHEDTDDLERRFPRLWEKFG